MLRFIANSVIVLFLTILTQIGGFAWLIALFFRQRLVAFILAYAALTAAAVWVAPNFGRVALNCFDDGSLQVQSLMYCALNRHYVTPELRDVLIDTADKMDRQYPGTETIVLDANFPFWTDFPCCHTYLTMMVRRLMSRFSTGMRPATCQVQHDHR